MADSQLEAESPRSGNNDDDTAKKLLSKNDSKEDSIPREVSTEARSNPWKSKHGKSTTMLPWTMKVMRPLVCCQACRSDWMEPVQGGGAAAMAGLTNDEDENNLDGDGDGDGDEDDIQAAYQQITASLSASTSLLPSHVVAPMQFNRLFASPTTQVVMQEYISSCQFYHVEPNSGVMVTLRLSLPALRVSGPFHDADMLALCEILARHQNYHLSFVTRLDFSRASKEGRRIWPHRQASRHVGFRSHGAICLAKVLQHARHVLEARLERHRIGPYGAAALFMGVSQNRVLRKLRMRRCRLGEKGGLAFAEILGIPSKDNECCGLQEIDLSANRIGFRGCMVIEESLRKRKPTDRALSVDLEGNLVLQEVMNGVTHGLGIVFAVVGFFLLSKAIENKPLHYSVACNIYSASLMLLYTSSTLYHSFFTMQNTKYIFEALDKCAIYILIAGSYTPFLVIALGDVPVWSRFLSSFIWGCCVGGIYVEAFLPSWEHKKNFSLLMYLGMGWAAIICYPDLSAVLPPSAISMIAMGGVAYTSGVPFFVRNNNLDHSIWHLFVLSGSFFHWMCVYKYVVTLDAAAIGDCPV